MTGDDRKRFCADCKLHVYNVAAMTLDEAEKLIVDSEGRACLQLFRRKDGTVMTKDCPVGLAEKFRRKVKITAAYVAGALTICGAIFAAMVENRKPTVTIDQIRTIKGCNQIKTAVDRINTQGMIRGKVAPSTYRPEQQKLAPPPNEHNSTGY